MVNDVAVFHINKFIYFQVKNVITFLAGAKSEQKIPNILVQHCVVNVMDIICVNLQNDNLEV